MLSVRLHGRGGQGVVTAAEVLSVAAFDDGAHAQAFPTFGSERTGAPVVAFCRIDTRPIRTREPIADPDLLVVMDPTLLHLAATFAGAGPGTTVLLNAPRRPEHVPGAAVHVLPATAIAREHTGGPRPNGPILGAIAATGAVSLPSVEAALRERFPGPTGAANAAAAAAAFAVVSAQLGAVAAHG